MKKKGKRLLALLLVMAIVITGLPISGMQIQSQAASKKTAVQKVTLNHSQYVMKKGQKLKLKAAVRPQKAKTKLKWKSSNPKVATVSQKGIVRAKGKKGKAKITATAGKKKASCKIIIGVPVKRIQASDLQLKTGETAKIKANLTPKKATVKKLNFQSKALDIVSVDKNGNVTALKEGKAQVVITAADCGKVKKTVTVTVTKKQENAADQPASPDTGKQTEKETETQKPTEKETETETRVPEGSYKIITYDGENKLEEVLKPSGTLLKDTKAPYVEGKIFLGWYYDRQCKNKISDRDVLKKDTVLYGNYGDAIPVSENGSPNYVSATDQKADFAIIVDAHKNNVSVQDVEDALILKNITDPSRTDTSDTVEKDRLKVTSLGNGKFQIKAEAGYQEGATYQLTIEKTDMLPELTFENESEEVIYYNFTIQKEETLNLSLDQRVKYLSASDSQLSKEDSEKIMAYTGLYQAKQDPETGETTYTPTNQSGSFAYTENTYIVGDVVAVYEGTRPDQRNLDTSLDEGVAYIKITEITDSGYAYKSADATDVLFTPDIIPVDIDEGDGVTEWTTDGNTFEIENQKLDFTTGYEDSGLDYRTIVEKGDFVAFYAGEYGNDAAVSKGYGKIITAESTDTVTKIEYETVTYDEMMASMDLYNQSDLTKKQLDAIDVKEIQKEAKKQVIESGFAQKASRYLAAMAVETDEVKELLGDAELELKDCSMICEDGSKVSSEEIMQLMENPDNEKLGKEAMNSAPEVKVKVSKKLRHFEKGSGFRVEVALVYNFDLQKQGNKNKIAVEMTAVFETEVLLGFSASGGAVWKTKWIIPYIYDYKMSGNIDQGLYTGIAITATAQLDEDEEPFGPEKLEPEGLDDYAQKILDLSESIKQKMEESKQAESAGTASGGLLEKYQDFIENASDKWIDLISVPIFEAEGSMDPFYVTAYSINVDFVVSASMNVAIGMSFQYEKSQRHTFSMMLFHRNESSSKTVDLSTERYQFDFYVMGTLGIRAGVRAKVLFGLFSTKLAGVGLQLEAGAYARLWGYFYYCLSWEKGKERESSATGAMLIEIGAYIELNLAMEVLDGTLAFNPSLYSNEWPIWNAGERENVLDFAYDEEGKWTETKGEKEIKYQVPLSFDMLRETTLQVPNQIFRMRYMDLKEGEEGYLTYDSNKRASTNPSSERYNDEERFFVEMSNPVFDYNPVTNQIIVNPEKGKYSYEGTMTITWKKPDITYASRTLSKTFEITWTDPEAGKCLIFDTQGGNLIRTQVYGPGAEIKREDVPKDPEKTGYDFGGWYLDKECTQKTEVPKNMPEDDLTLYAKWIPLPNEYTVRHYYEGLDTKYSLEETTLQNNVKTDDLLGEEKVIADNAIPKTGFQAAFIRGDESVAPDGSSVVEIYYKRQIHSVTCSLGELEDEDNPATVVRYRYGEKIIMPSCFMYGYTFQSWDKEPAGTMGTADLTYTAQWKANSNTPYYLEYYIKEPITGKYVMMGGANGRIYKEGTTGAIVNAEDYLLTDPGYTLKEIKVNGLEKNQGSIDPYGKLTIAYYYEGNPYDVVFDANGGVLQSTGKEIPDHYVHGVPLSVTDITAKKNGYHFIGWLEGDTAVKEISSFRTGKVTLTAEWRAVRSEVRLYNEAGNELLGTITAVYDEMLPSLRKIPEKPGYDFAGYYSEDGKLYYDEKGNARVLWQEMEGVSLKASFTPKKVTIHFDLNGADGELPAVEAAYLGKYPKLPDSEVHKAGYRLAGWKIEGDDAYVTENTTVERYDAHTLTADWAVRTDIPYTIEIYTETDYESGEYTLYTSYKKQGKTDETVSVEKEEYVIPGYAFDPTNEASIFSAKIKADGSTVFRRYYRKGAYHLVTFDYGNGLKTQKQLLAEGERIGMPDVTEPVNGQVLQGWSDGKMFVKGSTTMGTQDITYTAVWNYVTVTIQFDDWSQTINYSYDEPFEAPFNTQMKSPDTNEDGTTTYYRFKNWNTMEDGSGTSYNPGDEVAKKPLDEYEKRYNYYYQLLYAQWEEVTMTNDMVPYYVIYEIQDETSMYRSSVTEMYGKLGKQTQVPEYEMQHFTAGILNKDYEFIPGKTEQQIIKTGEEANGKEFGYEGSTVVKISYKRDSYNITLDFNGGQYNGKDSMSAEVLYQGNISMQLDTNIIPTKDKYEFIGWDVEIPEYMPAHDIVATAQYKETDSRAVKVEYYTENLDGKGYTLASSETVYGTVNTRIKPEPMEFSGFVTPEAKEVEVLDDGAAVCQYQYQRKEYNLIWDAGAGQLSGEGYTQGMVKYGAPITAPELTRAGYRGSFQNVAATMPAGNTIYQAQWDAEEVNYQIIYRKQKLDGSYTVVYSKGKMELAGKILSVSPEVGAGYEDEFGTGYIKPVTQIVEIAGDGSSAVYVDYALKRSRLNYDLSGASVAAGTYYTPEGDYYYGKTLRLPSLKYIKRTGYQILGWYDITDPEQKLVDGTNIVMGETDVTYKLKCEPITYTITYDLAEENAQNPNNPEAYQSGFEFNLSGAKCENMAFAGWEWAGKGQMPDGVQILENGLVYITSEATGDLKFRAKWEEEYRVFSAALFEGSTEQYTCFYPKKQEKTITLAEITPPVREGYIFACWSKKVPKETSGYYTLPLEDDTKVSSLNFNRDFLIAEWIRVSEFSGPYTQLHVSSQRELEVAAKLLKGDYLHRAIVLEEDITISNLTEPYFDRLEYDCYIKGSYTENGEEKHHTITLEHATAPLINENVGTIDGIDILGTVNGKEEASGEDTCFGAFARKNYGAIQNCRIVGTTNSFNEIIRSRIEGSAEYFGGFAGYNYGHITNCEIHDTDIVWNDQEAAKGGRKQAYVGGITGANDARAVLFGGKMHNAAVGVLSDHIRDTTQTVYLGGFAGSSSGKIQGGILENGKIGSITTRSDVQTIGRLYVGGIAGRDEEQKQENENGYQYESTISQCQVLNSSVGSAYTAGGIIGENNFSVISENTLDGVSVYGGCEYAGHIAGIWRSTCCAAKDNYIANARTATDTGTADIAAGYVEKPDGYDGVHATVMVRANDKNTKVITGNQSVSYMKGYFVCYFDRKGAHQTFYEMKYSGKEW